MGVWSWFFPTEESRIARARERMQSERWADARLEVLDLESAAAQEIVRACESELAKMNLEAAVSWCRAGETERVEHHLEMANNFRHDGLDDAFKDARRQMREIRAEKKEAAERAQAAEEARMLASDPGGASGNASWRDNSMPADFLDREDDEDAARLALVVEGYTLELRKTVGTLGGEFARALLDFEDGRPDLALQGLLALPDDQPVVRFERARTAYAMGDAAAAARELRSFAKHHGKHANMGRHHTGTFLALCLAESGDPAEALRVMRNVRATEPKEGGSLFAQLLQMNGHLDEAETNLLGLIRVYPKDSGLYKLLAGVQLDKDDRMKAMTVLEQALTACACSPGQCGYRPPDVGVLRTLASLYLEDRNDVARGLELAEQAAGLIQQPTWEDAYLQALAAERAGHPSAANMVTGLLDNTPPKGKQQERLTRYLTGPA